MNYEQARSECYKLLAVCFYHPEKEVFLEERLFENLSRLLEKVCPEAAAFAEKMGRAILNYSNEELLVDYAKLFVGPFELNAAPYGSVYLDEGRKTMGSSTMEVLKIYKDEGLSIDEDFKELPDHIAAELEFMYYLYFQGLDALQKGEPDRADHFIGVQEYFASRFLRPWIPAFCDKIKEGTDSAFYRALADCLSIFISSTTGNLADPDERQKVGNPG